MKKLLSMLLVAVMALSLVACQAQPAAPEATNAPAAEPTKAPEAAEPTAEPEPAFGPDPEKTITLIVPQGAGGGTDT